MWAVGSLSFVFIESLPSFWTWSGLACYLIFIITDDWDGQCHHQDPRHGTHGSDKHAQVGLGHHVTEPHRGHRHQRPPQTQRDGLEVVGWIDLGYISIISLFFKLKTFQFLALEKADKSK